MKQKVLDQYLHLTQQHTMKQFWINTFTSPTRCHCKNFKMPIYTKSTISKLENSRKMLEIVFLCTLNMLNFKRLAVIATEMYCNETKCFGSIPSPHQVHSCAIILVLDQYLHLTVYILLNYNFSFGSIPSPHRVYSCAVILKWP